MELEHSEPWIPRDTFGARLALVRQHMGWNTAQAAAACGLGDVNWRKWEHGRSPRNVHEVARQIADRTGCDYSWLMLGSSGGLALRGLPKPDLTVLDGGRRRAGRAADLQGRIPFLRPVK